MMLGAIEDVVSHSQVNLALLLLGFSIGVRLLHVLVVWMRGVTRDGKQVLTFLCAMLLFLGLFITVVTFLTYHDDWGDSTGKQGKKSSAAVERTGRTSHVRRRLDYRVPAGQTRLAYGEPPALWR